MKKLFFVLFTLCLLGACRSQQPITGDRFAQDVRHDIPFAISALSPVPGYAGTYAFRCDYYIGLQPDYEVDSEGAIMVYKTTFAPSHEKQPNSVIWRNIVFNRNAKRLLCIDRLVKNGQTFGYIYVLQSETRDYSDIHTYHWDVTNPSLMLNVTPALIPMTKLSVNRLGLK